MKPAIPVAALALLLAGALSTGCEEASTTKLLRFTCIPDQNTTELKEKFDPLAEYLARKLGIEVEYVPATDYQASVQMFVNGDVHLAWFGGLTGVQARHKIRGAQAIAQGREDPNYHSYFIAHKDTNLKRSDDFPQAIGTMSFTFGSESSTSGRLMPEYFIRQHTGRPPEAFFKTRPMFSGAHDSTIELVESGRVQVGAVNYKVYDTRVANDKTDPDTCKIIWVTPVYADYNFTAHPELDLMFGAGFIDKLQAALLEMDDPQLFAALQREQLIQAKNKDFEGIAAVASELGFLN